MRNALNERKPTLTRPPRKPQPRRRKRRRMQQRRKQMRRERVQIQALRSPLNNKISSLKLKQLRNHNLLQQQEQQPPEVVSVKEAIRSKSKHRASRPPSSIQAPVPQFRPIKMFNSIVAQTSTLRFSS